MIKLPADNLLIVTFDDGWRKVWELSFKFNSRAGYCENNRYKKHLQDTIGSLKLTEITPLMLETIKMGIIQSGRSVQTTKHILNLVKRVFNYLIKYDLYTGTNPVMKVTIPKKDSSRQRYLTKDEARLLLNALRNKSEQLWQISLLSLSTGMRAGEIFHLKKEHINLETRTIRIVDSKNGKNRSVFLPDSACQMLYGSHLKYGQLIFPNSNGQPYTSVSRIFTKTVKDLNLNDGLSDPRDYVVFHTLRHTYASWLIEKDQPLFVVSKLLGHSSLSMTQRYAHLSPQKCSATTSVVDFFLPYHNM